MTDTKPSLRPIGFAGSLLYFGIPCLFFAASILGVLPWMIRNGWSPYLVFNITFGIPLFLMLVAALVAYRLEGRPWTWTAFRDRMRLQRMTGRDWVWTAGLVLGSFGLSMLISPVAAWFQGVVFYTPPSEFPAFMGNMSQGDFGFDLKGRWDVFILMISSLAILNIGGEELWWRGIILPRQELAFGKWAWLVNGVLWDLFHFFYHTTLASVIGYLPTTVPLAFVAQRTRNTWPGIIAHLINNYALPVALLMKVLGK